MCVGVSVWLGWSGIRVAGLSGVVSVLQAETCNTDTTPTQPHRNSNTHWTKNNTTNVVIQQNSRKLLMMDILMSETCWAHKKWNKNSKWHEVGLLFPTIYFLFVHGVIYINCKEDDECIVYIMLSTLHVFWWKMFGGEIYRKIKHKLYMLQTVVCYHNGGLET